MEGSHRTPRGGAPGHICSLAVLEDSTGKVSTQCSDRGLQTKERVYGTQHSLESAARDEAILIYNNIVRSGPRAAVEHASEVVLAWAKSPVRIVEGMKSSAPQQHE